jgi:hypothetical protein
MNMHVRIIYKLPIEIESALPIIQFSFVYCFVYVYFTK